jgi:hypothetical protein
MTFLYTYNVPCLIRFTPSIILPQPPPLFLKQFQWVFMHVYKVHWLYLPSFILFIHSFPFYWYLHLSRKPQYKCIHLTIHLFKDIWSDASLGLIGTELLRYSWTGLWEYKFSFSWHKCPGVQPTGVAIEFSFI